MFITQQVGGTNTNDLSNKLIDKFKPNFPDFDLVHQKSIFLANNFKLLYEAEEFPWLRFFDVGAVVYFAKLINSLGIPEFFGGRVLREIVRFRRENKRFLYCCLLYNILRICTVFPLITKNTT